MVHWVILSTAFFTGFMGSLHCVAMCGPVAMALPLGNKTGAKRAAGILVYNLGRIATYSIIGMVLGSAGQGFSFFGLQRIVSVAAGALVILYVISASSISINGVLGKPFHWLKKQFQQSFSRQGALSLFKTGLLNGLLPCGLVYLALAGALAIGDIVYSGLIMAAFGAGTLPAMLSVSYVSKQVTQQKRILFSKVTPYFAVCMGLLFIVRGLSLGIPYLSPGEEEKNGKMEMKYCGK